MKKKLKSTKKYKKTGNALEILDNMMKGDLELQKMVSDAKVNGEVARLIYEARMKAGLTQSQLAKKISTTQPVIARLEDADYEGHSLTMLQRIASALDRKVEIKLVSKKLAA